MCLRFQVFKIEWWSSYLHWLSDTDWVIQSVPEHYRRKFRSQTSDSDNMDRWKSRGGKSQRKRKSQKRRSQKRERVRRKKIDVHEVEKVSYETQCFFNVLWRRRLKRRVRSHLARWEIKTCVPLRREADFEDKMHKMPHCRSTFGSGAVEKVSAVVARSAFGSQTAEAATTLGTLWRMRRQKKCTPLWREAHLQVKMYKAHQGRSTLLEVVMSKKCTPLWREALSEVKTRTAFWS